MRDDPSTLEPPVIARLASHTAQPLNARFVQGSILLHVLTMTATGAVGLLAIFFVDFLSLLYVSWLGDARLTASVGYATQILFLGTSIGIGLTIATTALVSRALGSGDFALARRRASSCLAVAALTSALVGMGFFLWRRPLLALLGAEGETAAIAADFLAVALPANVFLGAGMVLGGILRAQGDGRRAMMVTLVGAIVTAIADPIMIFGFGWGVYGAAAATVLSRLTFTLVGWHGASRVHHLLQRPRLSDVLADARPILSTAVPAILTNLATPVGGLYVLATLARFGPETVAAQVILDRVLALAFAPVFALTGAVGGIFGQNFGARRYDRIGKTLESCLAMTCVYALVVWASLHALAPAVADFFHAPPGARDLILFYCGFPIISWVFLSAQFVANTAFNNLGHPIYSTAFNWGRTALGVVPFVYVGERFWGVKGVFLAQLVGSALFGLSALATAFLLVRRLAKSAAGR